MKVVIQRVTHAKVEVRGSLISEIGKGMLILHGVEVGDSEEDLEYILKKTLNLRIFDDANGVMNESILQQEGEILCVSQFTLLADTRKGNRPSYIKAEDQSYPPQCMINIANGCPTIWVNQFKKVSLGKICR